MELMTKFRKTIGKEFFLNTEAGKVRVLAYNMDNPEKLPLFVNIHGGGFVIGNAELDDPYLKPQPKGALNPKTCRAYNAAYCTKEEAKNPLVSPIFATALQVKSFPPTLVITAEYDSLCEEGEKFGETLKKAGVNITHKRFEAKHGFTCSGSDVNNSNAAWQMMIDHLKLHLHESM